MSSAPEARGRVAGEHLACLDGLRAVAAASVAVYHVAFRTIDPLTPAGTVLHRLDLGVLLFFVISGFLLYRPFVSRLHAGRPAPALGEYALRRVIRIYPPYWLAVAVTVHLVGLGSFSSWGSVFAHYSLTQNYFPQFVFGQGLGHAWTLPIEITFYAALPFYAAAVAVLARRIGPYASEVVCLAGVVAAGMVCQTVIHYHVPLPVWVNVLPISAPLFAAGMALAIAAVRIEERGAPEWVARLARHPGLLAALAGAAFVAEVLLLRGTSPRAWTPAQWVWRFVLGDLLSLCLVAIAVVGPQDVGLVRRALSHPVVVWAGSVSYGIYLWHPTVATLLFDGLLGGARGVGPFVALVALSLPAASAVAAASWYLLEQPLIRWAHERHPRAAMRALPPAQT